jgi:sphingomyelin phosphodiesterase 2
LTDAYLQSHPQLPAHAVSLPDQRGVRPDPRRCLSELGITCDSPLNTWTAGKPLDERAIKGAGKRLDYIFFRGPADKHTKETTKGRLPNNGRLKCTDSSVTFTDLIEGHEISFSDHYGLEATFAIHEEPSPPRSNDTNSTVEDEGQSAYNSRLSQTLTSSLSALSAALIASRQSQKWHYMLFLGLLILALSTIGLSSSRSMGGGALSGLWTFVAVICGWTGSTAFYSAVVWGEWEKSEWNVREKSSWPCKNV